MRLLLWLILALDASAAVLRVPADYPGVQQAIDASQAGDTVRVDRGVWTGLLESPAHTLLLCSNYPFTQDSTDIAETILDGEHVGTILTVHTGGEEVLTVRGLTFWRGQGHQDSNSGYHIRAGAVQMVSGVSAVFEDVVFADCRAPRRGSILFHGVYNSANYSTGSLTLRRIHCRGTQVDTTLVPAHAFQIHATQSQVIVDGFYWDGGNTNCPVLKQASASMDSLAFTNVRIINCSAGADVYWPGITPNNISLMSNIYSDGCHLSFRSRTGTPDGTTRVIRNIEITGVDSSQALFVLPQYGWPVLLDSIHVHHNRMKTDQASMIHVRSAEEGGHVLRNLNFHDNIQGDSTNAAFNYPYPFISLTRCDLVDASIRNNTVIMAPDPAVGDTPGHVAEYGAMVSVVYGSRRIENVHFENNRVDDLDVYTQTSPLFAPTPNMGRELYVDLVDTLVIRNLTVRNSRMDNPVPEVVASDGVGMSGPGNAVVLLTRYTDAQGILFENCDDGALFVGGEMLLEGAVFRNVKRAALFFGTAYDGSSDGDKVLRNIHVENLVGGASWLSPEDLIQGRQSVLTTLGQYYGAVPPSITLENVTITGCSNLPYLFNAFHSTNLFVRNSIFNDNDYDMMVEHDEPLPQTWEYNIVEEPVTGIGNQVGIDPWFDEELGAPWLSPLSPAIDAGHPNLVYNDIEDPDNPGLALWPSQGTLRNDIGYTGGPYAGTLEHLVAVRPPVTERPAALPQGFTLHPAHPNPFNPSTTVSYTLARPMQVELSVYNLLGQQVRTLAYGMQDAGVHSVPFTAGELASGVYVVELQAGGHSQTQKVLLLK